MYIFFSERKAFLFRFSIMFFVLLLFSHSQSSYAKKRLVLERILAVVNNDIILWSEWRQRVEAFKLRLGKTLDEDERKKQIRQLEQKVLNKMIEDKLLEQDAVKKHVRVSNKEVNAATEDTRKRHQLSKNQFREALREQGYTMTTYKVMVRRELNKLRLLQRVLRQKVTVSEEEIKKYYADMTRGMKAGATEYRVRQMMVMVDKKASPAVLAKKKRIAQNILQLALGQQDLSVFTGLVSKFSEGPWKDKKGDLGFLEPDSLPKVIADVCKHLKVNKVYPKLLRSSLGFHIIFLQAKRNAGLLSYKEAKPKIQKKLQQIGFQREYKRYVKSLKQKAILDIRLKNKEK